MAEDSYETIAIADDNAGFLARCVCYLENGMDEPGAAAFEVELEASQEKRRSFVRLCSLRARVIEGMAGMQVQPQMIPRCAPDEPSWLKIKRVGRWTALAAGIALLALAGSIFLHRPGRGKLQVVTTQAPTRPAHQPVQTEPIARLVSAIDADWAGITPSLGEPLPGDTLYIAGGLAEIRLRNDVILVVQGPSQFQVISPDQIHLDKGILTAKVSPQGHGFTVQTPTAQLVDLGTEFGVSVSQASTEMLVFQGKVQVQPSPRGANFPPLLCAAGNGARATAAGAQLLSQDKLQPAAQYVRNIRQVRQRVPLFSTGQMIDETTGADTRWQIVSRSDMPAAKPMAAFPYLNPKYLNDDGSSRWISSAPDVRITPPGLHVRFRTRFELAGFDPKTVRLTIQLAADDAVEDVYLNGVPLGIRLKQYNVDHLTEFVVDHGFLEGLNNLEIAVLNIGENGEPSPFAVRAKLDGTAIRRALTPPEP